jgi:hypothetical protein
MTPVRMYGSFRDGQLFVRYYQVGVDFLFISQAGADRTGAVRIIEAEIPGSYFTETESAVNAGEML